MLWLEFAQAIEPKLEASEQSCMGGFSVWHATCTCKAIPLSWKSKETCQKVLHNKIGLTWPHKFLAMVHADQINFPGGTELFGGGGRFPVDKYVLCLK